jgi:Kef-type K+ transport system membrane component KefB
VNEILSVGLILVAALMAGHAAQVVKIPEVTGYLMVGLLIGPSGFDLLTHENLQALGFLSEVALGLILFSIGSIFELRTIRALGPGVARITLWEAWSSFALVFAGVAAVGLPLPVALLLGVIAMETAPATTLMVLHEYDAKGPLTDRLLVLIAVNNLLVLATFGVVASVLGAAGSGDGWLVGGYRAVYGVLWTLIGSAALGVLLGLVMDAFSGRLREVGESMTLTMGFVLLAVGASRAQELSPLVSSLALGAVVANTSRHGELLLSGLRRADPPLYAAFFVLAGAELQLSSVAALGAAGAVYCVLRAAGKIAGARLGMRGQEVPETVRRYLGLCIVSSSSLAVGLTLQVRARFPELAPQVTAVVLAAVLIFEVVGPLLIRQALVRSGEAQTTPDPLADL